MAQHDYVIDNSTGANVRADINSVLLAISSNNSGSSAPSTTYALQTFANTTDSMLQLRNAANNAFVDLRKFDGTLPLPDGSVSSPSLFLSDDTNTGLFSSAADTLNFTTGGVERLELGGTTIFNEDGADVDFRIEGDTEANLFYVDAGNDRIGIGTSSPSAKLHVVEATSTTAVKIKSGTSTNQSTHVTLFNDSDAPLNLGVFGSAAGTAGAIAANTAFMSTNSAAGLAIAANNASGTIKFGTGSSTTTRMFIDSSGNVSVGGTSPSTQSAKFQTHGTSQNETRINMHHEGNSSASISANGGLVFGSDTSNGTTQRMIIDTSGNIGAPSGTNIFNASDSRVKTNVVNLEKGLSDIKSLRPVSFNWIDGFCDEEKNTLYGFIAQEVQTVDSNLIQDFSQEITVKDTKIENVLRVNEKFIIPMLVKAIQELSAKVEALEAA